MPDPADELRWFMIEASVAEDDLDLLCGRLWAASIGGIEERRTSGGLQIVVSAADAVRDAVQAIVGERLVSVREASRDEGLDGWRPWARSSRVGNVVIEPAWWTSADATKGERVVRIDPGHVFGSGAHVTTRLALELLQQTELQGRTVLDVGTGSGVLAIVAAVLGAHRVVAIDVDDATRQVALANVEANAVDGIVEIPDASVDALAEEFDVVVANIDSSTLIGLSRSIAARCEPHGTLILSGMLDAREADVTTAFPGVAFGERRSQLGWVAASGERVALS